MQIFGPDGHFIFILFLILPFLQPIPLFGLSTPFGVLISFIAILFYFNRPPIIPKKWQSKKLKKETVFKIAHGSEVFFRFLGRFLRPRLQMFFRGPFKFINVAIIFVNAILLALPLPIPFSNAVPAWTILFQAIAHMERDGILIVLSYLQAIASLIFFTLLFYGAVLGFDLLKYLMS